MCLLKQVSFSEQQKMQHILATQRDYLRLKQSHEELQYEHRNIQVEVHMLRDANEK